jgi:hypothetical protein
MNITINPVVVDDVTCTEAALSAAVSTGASINLVPVSPDGIAYPQAGIPMLVAAVGGDDAGQAFLAAVADAVQVLAQARGI